MSGYLGLTKSINDRQSATQDLAVLERMEGRQKQEQAQEMQAQIMQDQMYQQMYQQADGLLDKDRKRINKQIKAAQSQVQTALDQWGGSKTKFLANGGLGIMSNIQTDILHSEEAERYKSNKENLARILEAQEKGLGHLLSPNDIKAVEDYHANEEGATITYSGMMTEIEIPHDKFSLGEEIKPYYIMNHNANLVKILGNYAKVHPDKPEPEKDDRGNLTEVGRAEVMAFMKQMGYGGMGQSAALMQAKLARQSAVAKEKAAAEQRSVLGVLNEAQYQIPKGLTADKIDQGYMNKLMNADGNDTFRDMFAGDFKARARRRDLAVSDTDIVGEVSDWFSQDEAALRGSKKVSIAQSDINNMAYNVFGIKPEGNKISGFSVDGEMFGSDGTKIGDNKRFKAEDYGKDFELLGMVTAFETAVEDGKSGSSKDILLMDLYDDDGGFDKDATDKFYKNQYGDQNPSEARLGYYMALRGKDGDMVYQKVNIQDTAIRSSLKESFGAANDISDEVGEAKQYDAARLKYQEMNSEQALAFEEYKQSTKPVFEDPFFKAEADKYVAAGSGGTMNRNKMMQAFYMAYDSVGAAQTGGQEGSRLTEHIDGDKFTAHMTEAGVIEDLRDYDKSPDEIIQKFVENINKGEDPGSFNYKVYTEVAQKWQQMLKAL